MSVKSSRHTAHVCYPLAAGEPERPRYAAWHTGCPVLAGLQTDE